MEDVRDIVIIVFGIGATVAMLALLLMALILFRKVTAIVDTAKSTMNRAETLSRDVLEPATRAYNVLGGIWRVISSLLGQERKEPKGTDDGI